MNNEELKKKIVDILDNKQTHGVSLQRISVDGPIRIVQVYTPNEDIADALIAAGIGDVSKWKAYAKIHRIVITKEDRIKQLYSDEEVDEIVKEREEFKYRALVAERALKNSATRLKCNGGFGKGFCSIRECEYYHCDNDEGCIKAHLEQAEKELAEEKKE